VERKDSTESDRQHRCRKEYDPQEHGEGAYLKREGRFHCEQYAIRYSTDVTDEGNIAYRVRRSGPGLGHGLFAARPLRAGEIVIEYTGRHVTNEEADRLKTKYLFELNDQWAIDGSARSNIARYINHSCDPNCEAEVDDGRVLISAARDIETGEELTYDYGEEYFEQFIRPKGCRCARCQSVTPKAAVTSAPRP